MKFDEPDGNPTLPYNGTAVILTSDHAVTTRIKQQEEMQHKTKKKKARFFEQFCKYTFEYTRKINYLHIK